MSEQPNQKHNDEETMPIRHTVGPYTCMRVLGYSSNDHIYHAVNKSGQSVALRVFHIQSGDRDEIMTDCQRELEIIQQAVAPNLVELLDYGTDDNQLYIAMSLMQGSSLEARFNHAYSENPQLSPPSLGEIATLLERLADALDNLHVQGIMHGQVEPRNILFDESGDGYLADVGLTKILKVLYRMDTTNTLTISPYTPPEVWHGENPVPSSDQYALACLAYELTTGRRPFQSTSIFKLMQAHLDHVVTAPHHVNNELPADLAIPFWQAMAKPSDNRFPHCFAFVQAYRKAIIGYEGIPTNFFTKTL